MMLGSFRLTAGEVIGSVLQLPDDPSVDFVVRGLRLPTALSALAVGLALGASGTIFQQLLRNPLASPDFVGVSSGRRAGGGQRHRPARGRRPGARRPRPRRRGRAAPVLMYVLAWRGGVSGYRFILIGIGVAAFFEGLVGYVLSRAQLFEARQAMHWLTGSVGQANDGELRILFATVPVLLAVAVLLQRQLRVLELGDDAARGLGARTELSRAGLLATAVVLIALAVVGGRADRLRGAGGRADRQPAAGSGHRRHRWPRRWSAPRCCSPPTWSPRTCCPRRCRPAW